MIYGYAILLVTLVIGTQYLHVRNKERIPVRVEKKKNRQDRPDCGK